MQHVTTKDHVSIGSGKHNVTLCCFFWNKFKLLGPIGNRRPLPKNYSGPAAFRQVQHGRKGRTSKYWQFVGIGVLLCVFLFGGQGVPPHVRVKMKMLRCIGVSVLNPPFCSCDVSSDVVCDELMGQGLYCFFDGKTRRLCGIVPPGGLGGGVVR